MAKNWAMYKKSTIVVQSLWNLVKTREMAPFPRPLGVGGI